jgi:hypothetical protein
MTGWTSSQVLLRGEMKANRGFLKKLYDSGTNKEAARDLIRNGEEKQLAVLCQVLAAVADGKIPMTKNLVKLIPKRKMNTLNKCKKWSQSKPDNQSAVLNSLGGAYGTILFRLFNDQP